MALRGAGVVAIWHDLAPEAWADFYAWHGTEHLPERLAIPGFLRGRRFHAVEADLPVFNTYETETPETASSPGYQARLDDPTPWSQRVMPNFRRMTRSVCRVEASLGAAQGGMMMTWRYDVEDAEAHRRAMIDRLLPAALARPGVAAAHLLSADLAASGLKTEEQRVRGAANMTPPWILMVEGWSDAEAMRALRRDVLNDAALAEAGVVGEGACGLYRHEVTLDAA